MITSRGTAVSKQNRLRGLSSFFFFSFSFFLAFFIFSSPPLRRAYFTDHTAILARRSCRVFFNLDGTDRARACQTGPLSNRRRCFSNNLAPSLSLAPLFPSLTRTRVHDLATILVSRSTLSLPTLDVVVVVVRTKINHHARGILRISRIALDASLTYIVFTHYMCANACTSICVCMYVQHTPLVRARVASNTTSSPRECSPSTCVSRTPGDPRTHGAIRNWAWIRALRFFSHVVLVSFFPFFFFFLIMFLIIRYTP